MKRVTFYYVRHGRTEFNRDGIIQGGRVDSPLAEESRTRAARWRASILRTAIPRRSAGRGRRPRSSWPAAMCL